MQNRRVCGSRFHRSESRFCSQSVCRTSELSQFVFLFKIHLLAAGLGLFVSLKKCPFLFVSFPDRFLQ